MSALIQGVQLRTLLLGTKIDEPAATLPATTTANIFTVSGGRILITSLVGTCTTVCTATATTLSIGLTPTTGTAQNAGIATATAVTSSEVGTLVSVNVGAAPGALIVGAKAGAAVNGGGGTGLVVEPGTITITTSATNTGAFSWTMTYIEYDDGSSASPV